jgi:Peptidase family C25
VSLYRDVDVSHTISMTASPGGNVTATLNSTTVTGTGNLFLNYHAGEPLLINGAVYTIASVQSATTLTLTTSATATYTGATWSGPSAGAGTVSVTVGSAAVTGTGTTFTNYRAGDPITINNGGTTNVVYTILSITDATHLTLTTTYAGTTNPARAYYGPGDALLGTVTTDANGQYLFPGLANGSYIVSVPAQTGYNYIPGGRTDSDATFPGIQLAATINGTANILDRDFGFQAQTSRTISGLIWNNNVTVNGAVDPGETLLSGVTVSLLAASAGAGTVSTTSGSAAVTGGGAANFTTLSPGQAIVIGGVTYTILSITDATHLTLSTTASANNTNVAYSVSGSTVATTTTASDGTYSFTGLASGTYIVRVTDANSVLTGYTANYQKTGTTVGPFTGQEYADVTGGNQANLNFGYSKPHPTYASVDAFAAFVSNRGVTVQWRTSSELGTIGFDLLRYDPATGSFVKLNRGLLPGLVVHPEGGVYRFRDDDAPLQGSLTYRLVEIDLQDARREHGPFTVTVGETAPQSASPGAQDPLWTDEPFQRRPNEITTELQQRLQTAAAEQLQVDEATISVIVGGGGTAKITTTSGGLTYVTASQIGSALGITKTVAAALIAIGGVDLTSLGAEIAYLPASGGSGLYFYANQPQTIYSTQTAYLLTSGRGTIMGNASKGFSGSAVTSFASTLHLEQNQTAAPALFTNPDGDFWLWDYVFVYPGYAADSKSFAVPVAGVAGTGAASLKVHLVGGNDDTASPADHHAVISWNGTPLSPAAQWDGTNPFDLIIPINPATINEGANTLTLEGDLDSGVAYSLIYLDYFELTYQRLFRASNDTLTFTVPSASASTVTVTGFSSSDILVLDLGTATVQASAPGGLVTPQPSVVSPVITASGDGTYQAQFVTPSGRTSHSYLAAVRKQAKAPAAVAAMTLAGLKSLTNRADYILIAPDSLVSAATTLAAYRATQRLETKVVALKDIYNEFNYGNASPYAIQTFLSYAVSTWQRSPRYATLVGRGTYDYKNYLGVGDCLVPPLLTATPSGLFVSDNRIADFSGGFGVPEIALGRLPVLTAQDVTNYLAKIQAREQAPMPSQILMAADNPDQGGSFNVDSDAVAALVPRLDPVLKVYLGQGAITSGAIGEQAIINAINGGVMIFNYIGHGGPGQLADENLFQVNSTVNDVDKLTNAGAMPIFLGMTCASGNFGYPGHPSLAEDLLLKQGGGVYASWASTGLSEDEESVQLNEAFYTTTFGKGTTMIGDIIVTSMQTRSLNSIPASMKDLYNLLGEPVSKIR